MIDINKHLISSRATLKEALSKINELPQTLTLFAINDEKQLVGTITDGDIRRSLIEGIALSDKVENIMFRNFRYLEENKLLQSVVTECRKLKIRLLPVINQNKHLIKVYDLSIKKSILPLDVVIMAGGRGERLRPLTDSVPKPLLKIGDKTIIEHNIDNLSDFGIENFHISVRYLADQIIDFLGDGSKNNLNIKYISETKALGTIGALKKIEEYRFDDILLMNSDLFTNFDYEEFYLDYKSRGVDLSIATIPSNYSSPYAILEIEEDFVKSIREKPTYTYLANAGIYLFNKKLLSLIPKDEFYNATDFAEDAIKKGFRVAHFPILGYWIDIGLPEDYRKATELYQYIKH
jgi:dTDP-glucose pyrophosphorylase